MLNVPHLGDKGEKNMTKQQLIKNIVKLNDESIKLSKTHNKMLNKYTKEELESIYFLVRVAMNQARAQIEIIKAR